MDGVHETSTATVGRSRQALRQSAALVKAAKRSIARSHALIQQAEDIHRRHMSLRRGLSRHITP